MTAIEARCFCEGLTEPEGHMMLAILDTQEELSEADDEYGS
jgi:hypothetical protein